MAARGPDQAHRDAVSPMGRIDGEVHAADRAQHLLADPQPPRHQADEARQRTVGLRDQACRGPEWGGAVLPAKELARLDALDVPRPATEGPLQQLDDPRLVVGLEGSDLHRADQRVYAHGRTCPDSPDT